MPLFYIMDRKRNLMKKIEVSEICVNSTKIPKAFTGSKILHISDLHGNVFGKRQSELIRISKELKPDYIFITGDIIDEHCKNLENVYAYIYGIRNLAPIYYVTGNHEWISKDRVGLLEFLHKSGVHVLQDQKIEIERGGEKIQLLGTDDPYRMPGKKTVKYQRVSTKVFIKRFVELNRKRKRAEYTILLSHRPELFHFYVKAGVDLVFSGHAHGGQFRIPGKGGLLAPHQGFFPKYTEGVICENDTKMVVSRGLGNSGFPFRIGNPYELVVVTLKREE